MLLSIVSLDQNWEDKVGNMAKCKCYINQAAKFGSQMVIFPELTLTGFTMRANEFSENISDSETIRFFQALACEYNMGIHFGMITGESGSFFNSAVTLNQKGEMLSNYKKMHPFSFSGENRYFSAGNETTSFDFQNVSFGSSICYDLRFPELFSTLGRGNQAIINIANWPSKRIDHWRKLLMARAIENQLFMIGANRTGVDGNQIVYENSSMVVGPDGCQMSPIYSKDNHSVYLLDFELALTYRRQFPTFKDRRPDLYRKFL